MRLVLLFSILIAVPQVVYSQAWELKKKADSIEVFTRTVNNTAIKEFKAVAKINASAEQILAILQDVPGYPQWIEDVSYTETVTSSEDQLSFYYQMNLPWPIKDRDLCLDMQIARTTQLITVQLSSNPDLIPVDDDFVRMMLVEGHWLIKPVAPDRSEVEHQFLADPEGSLPAWVVNMFAVDGPYQTMKNLRQYVKEE